MHIIETFKHFPLFLFYYLSSSLIGQLQGNQGGPKAQLSPIGQPPLHRHTGLFTNILFPVISGPDLNILLSTVFCVNNTNQLALAKLLYVCTWTYLMLCLVSLGVDLSICSEGCPSVLLSALKAIYLPRDKGLQ